MMEEIINIILYYWPLGIYHKKSVIIVTKKKIIVELILENGYETFCCHIVQFLTMGRQRFYFQHSYNLITFKYIKYIFTINYRQVIHCEILKHSYQ